MTDWLVVVDVRPPDDQRRLWNSTMRGYETAVQAIEHATVSYDPGHIFSVEAERISG